MQKETIENVKLKILGHWVGGWMDGWMGGWMLEPVKGLLTAIKNKFQSILNAAESW